MTEPAPRVSVVVPVFDPGRYIEPAIRSILAQTLPPGQLEAVFVDDGSTDGTAARLDRLAAEHPSIIRVIHIAPSGAPGRPRNLGIEAARGDYIQFLDADDELAPDALERVVAMADRNGSDVVVEKFASASMPRSQRLFERSVERTTLVETPTLADSSLGPAKLYRRAFLLANAIRFPEGWRQMEDQAFTIHAYARAGSIAVCADRPCYFFNRRDDGGHLTAERIEPDRHFRNLRTVLDLVDAETAPGALRDRIVRRMLRVEVLNRVSEPVYLELTDEGRARLFTAARDLVRERIDQRVIDDLGPVRRLRCELLRDDRPDDLLALDRQLQDLDLTAVIDRIDWEVGVLRLSMTAGLGFRSSGQPLRFAPPDDDSGRDTGTVRDRVGDPYEVAGDAGLIRVQLVLRSRPSVLEWYVDAPARPLRDRIGATARARIDPLRLGAGSLPLAAGSWDVHLRLTGLGIEWSAPLGVAVHSVRPPRPALLGDPGRLVVPIFELGGLRLEVDPPAATVASVLRAGPIRVLRDGLRVVVVLPMAAGRGAGPLSAALVIGADGDDARLLPALLRPMRGRVVVDAAIERSDPAARGSHPLALRLGRGEDSADVPLGSAIVDPDGRVRIEGLDRVSTAARIGDAVAWEVTRARWPIERRGRRLASATRRIGRRVVRSLRPRSGTDDAGSGRATP